MIDRDDAVERRFSKWTFSPEGKTLAVTSIVGTESDLKFPNGRGRSISGNCLLDMGAECDIDWSVIGQIEALVDW